MLLFPSYFVSFPSDFIEHKSCYCARFNIRKVKYQPFGVSSVKLHMCISIKTFLYSSLELCDNFDQADRDQLVKTVPQCFLWENKMV